MKQLEIVHIAVPAQMCLDGLCDTYEPVDENMAQIANLVLTRGEEERRTIPIGYSAEFS